MTIASGALLNLLGHGAPLLAALFVVPALVARLDVERFGFLALAWVLVGYFSLFDLGVGKALTRIVAERAGTSGEGRLAELSRTALGLTLGLGVIAGVVLFAAADWICRGLLGLTGTLAAEAAPALRVLAACLPLVTLTAALRGLLEAGRHFGWVNLVRIPQGVLTFAAPLAVLAWSAHLAAICGALAAVRVAALAAHWGACAALMPALSRPGWPQGAAAREMLGYGAWLTVSNVFGPIMIYVDRVVIGALVSVAAVAYYSAPYEVLTRFWIIPAALTGALFPAFAAADAARARALYAKGIVAIVASVVPLALGASLLAPHWLTLWLDDTYAAAGTPAARWLALGVGANCLAYLPHALLQARGRADLTGKVHVAELPLYLAALAWLVPGHGIEGAALAWAGRCALDAIVLFALAPRALRAQA